MIYGLDGEIDTASILQYPGLEDGIEGLLGKGFSRLIQRT